MKKLTILFLLFSVIANGQTIKIDFHEQVAIQDLQDPYEFNTYQDAIYGKGVLKFDLDDIDCPMHLIVNTKDNKRYSLILIPGKSKNKLSKITWKSSDLIVDAGKGEYVFCEYGR